MIATVTLYYNTGFNTKNIPDGPSLLNGMTTRTFESNYELQNDDITSCYIEATWDDVKNADYLKLGNCYYFILSRSMENENCAQLFLDLDALTSMGGPSALSYSGGIIERAHVSSSGDGLFANVVEEDVGPLKPIKIIEDGAIAASGSNSVTIVGSTLSLTEPGVLETTDGGLTFSDPTYSPRAFTYIASVGQKNYSATLPQSPPMPTESTITIDGHSNTLSGVGLYNYTTHKANIQYLRMLNLDGAILYCYNLPTGMGGSSLISGVHGTGVLNPNANCVTLNSNAGFVRNDYPNARNNKVYAMYSTYRLSFDISGDEQIFNACDLYTSGLSSPQFKLTADPQPNGFFIAFPKYFNGKQIASYNFKSVHSLPWKNTPIAFNTEAGSLIQQADKKIAGNKIRDAYWSQYGNAGGVKQMFQGASRGSAGGLSGMLMGALAGGGAHLGSLITQGLNNGKDLYNPLTELEYEEAKRSLIVPDLTSNPAVGLQNVVPESLRLQYLGPDSSDLARFDLYFDLYGYAMAGTVFNKSYLSNRQYCNYIKASDIHITSDSTTFGLNVKSKAERTINNGVRIWHIKPQPISSNPKL